jgi:hypothetical protein
MSTSVALLIIAMTLGIVVTGVTICTMLLAHAEEVERKTLEDQ